MPNIIILFIGSSFVKKVFYIYDDEIAQLASDRSFMHLCYCSQALAMFAIRQIPLYISISVWTGLEDLPKARKNSSPA